MNSLLGICDGYDERGFVEEERGLHPALRFVYRPMLVEERTRLLNENDSLKPAQRPRNTAKVLALKIKSWDLKDRKGEPVPVAEESILKLRPRLYERVLGIVSGLDACDDDPQATTEEKKESLADELAAAEQGRPVADVRAERDAGN